MDFDNICYSLSVVNGTSLSWYHPCTAATALAAAYSGYAGDGATRTLTAYFGAPENPMPPEVVTAGDPFTDGLTPTIFGFANPASNAANITVACAGGAMSGYAYSISVVDSDPATVFNGSAAGTGDSTAPTVTCPSASGAIVMDALSTIYSTYPPTVGAGQTQRMSQDIPGTGDASACGSTEVSSGSSVVMSWTLPVSRQWDIVAASFKLPGAAPSGSPIYAYNQQ